MRTLILGIAVVALVAVGCGDDDDDGDAAVDGGGGTGDKGGGGDGAGNGGTSGGDGGLVGSGGSGGGVVIGDGTQLAGCMTSMQCDPGLSCYTFGGYCSAQCGSDADCTSLGDNYGCYLPAGAGMGFPGIPGGMMGTGGAAAGSGGAGGGMTLAGTCRISCMGLDDTSCPDGFMCIDVGGGGGMAGTFRCALPGVNNGNNGTGGTNGGTGGAGGIQTPGTTPAFGQCQGGGCLVGLICSRAGGAGYCTQECDTTADCTNEPSSGDVSPTCSARGRCSLPCTEDEEACPDDMTCTVMGGGNNNNEDGGAPRMGSCNYSN